MSDSRELEGLRRRNAALERENSSLSRQLRSKQQYPVINGHQTGPYTGRCHKCGSSDLWDDYTAYGCNKCGMLLVHG